MAQYKISNDDAQFLLNNIYKKYGYDFLKYSLASLTRRMNNFIEKDNILDFTELNNKVMSNEIYFARFIEELTVNITEMFRDPAFFVALKEKVFPQLATYNHVKIWHAGCSTGEEVYSMAILLEEEGLLDKTLIYATDINPCVLESARSGFFMLDDMKRNNENYLAAKGEANLSDYFITKNNRVLFNESLRENVVFSMHNLATDQSFNEFHLIICRNVLIYFNNELQKRVIELFDKSLIILGYLGLGSNESLIFSDYSESYKVVNRKERIWKKTS